KLRGYNMFRAQNPNTPLPGTGVRPDSNLFNVTRVESTGTATGDELTFTLRTRVVKVLRSSVVYTYAHASNNTKGPTFLPADPYNLGAEMGRADLDIRHKLNMASVLTLPHEVQIGAVMVVKSGPPFDIISGIDTNSDGIFNDRPPGVTRNTGQAPGY